MDKILKFRAVAMAAMALFYGASPVDLIPDLIPVLGVLDDAVIVPVLLLLAFASWRRAKSAKAARVAVPAPGNVEFIAPPHRISSRR